MALNSYAGMAKRIKAAVCKTANHRFKSDYPLQLLNSSPSVWEGRNAVRSSLRCNFHVGLSLTGKATHCECGDCGFKSRRSTQFLISDLEFKFEIDSGIVAERRMHFPV